MPDKCPGCGAELVRYLLARKKGVNFEEKVREIIQRILGGNPKRDRFSGSRDGLKGDLFLLPKPLNTFVVECKDDKSLQIHKWWKQVKDEGVQMAKNPLLVLKLEEDIVLMGKIKDILELLA
jgi:hypothetical protein